MSSARRRLKAKNKAKPPKEEELDAIVGHWKVLSAVLVSALYCMCTVLYTTSSHNGVPVGRLGGVWDALG